MPVLFNRWHDCALDYGGIYVDHFFPPNGKDLFVGYLEDLVGAYKGDPRIFAWDLCNEPDLGTYNTSKEIAENELTWLKSVYGACKSLGPAAPLTVGIHPFTSLELIDPISDVLSMHPYWYASFKQVAEATPHISLDLRPMYDNETYETKLDAQVAFARKVNKPLIATECCWGDLQDEPRAEGIRYTLTQLKKRGIGWTAYLLHHSLIVDAHRPEFGPVGMPGTLAFIEADGSLRAGHGIFNEF
jgi:hypothetical protein